MESIGSVKRRLEYKEGIRCDLLRLMYGGRVLEDERTLASYNILEDSTLRNPLPSQQAPLARPMAKRSQPETLATPAPAAKRLTQPIVTNEVCADNFRGLATPPNCQVMCDSDYKRKLKVLVFHQAKASVALSELLPEFRSRPPGSVLAVLEDLKREVASGRSKEKDLEATITRLTHQNKKLLHNKKRFKDTISSLMHRNRVLSSRFALYESQLVALETENKKTKEELLDADKKYLGARIAGHAEGLLEGKTNWLKSVEFLDHLAEATLLYFNYGFDSCQTQAEQQGFAGLLDKDSALKNAPLFEGWESS